MNKLFFLFISSALVFSETALTAACCGGGFAAPSLIAGDEKAQLTSSITSAEVSKRVDARGIWARSNSREKTSTLNIQGAHIFNDRYQVGGSLPIIQKEKLGERSSGIGDVTITGGYEYLTNWDYNLYRPKGIGYIQLALPTGKSLAESENPLLIDSRGKGFLGIGVGTLLTKAHSHWDGFVDLNFVQSFKKDVADNEGNYTLTPGLGSKISFGVGYNFRALRLGSDLSWLYEDGIKKRGGSSNYETAPYRYGEARATVSYVHNTIWAGTVAYSDQTLIGSPTNTPLARALTLSLQRRWSR